MIALAPATFKKINIGKFAPAAVKKIETEHVEGEIYTDKVYEEYHNSNNKKIFEKVIEDMMLAVPDKTFEKYIDEIRKIISGYLPAEKKRFAILSILDSNRNLLAKARILKDKGINRMEHIKDIIPILRSYVKVSDTEIKKYGEVMTPISLVTEMLNTLPREVWSNPDLKWLDPCNGCGPFLALVVAGLMKGLSEWEPDENKRYEHILENMVYAGELQPKNMFLWMMLMNPHGEHNMNVYTGSFLDENFDKHMKETWKVDKFDIIVGNPPYQDNSDNGGSGHTLWDKFLLKNLLKINKNGYIIYVHPSGWRNISGSFEKIKNEILKRDLLYLEIHNINSGIKTFGAATRYDFYVLRNSFTKNLLTKIIDEEKNICELDVKNINYIPNKLFNLFINLIAKFDEDKVEIINERSMYGADKKHMSTIKIQEYIYPCVKYISKKIIVLILDTLILKKVCLGYQKYVMKIMMVC